MLQIDKSGWVIDAKVTKEHRPAIEHGALNTIRAIVLHQTGALTASKAKPYPARFPHNHDSIGIEIVGALNQQNAVYDLPNQQQLDAVLWLLDRLVYAFSITISDIYAHGEIAHKDPNKSEGRSAMRFYLLDSANGAAL